MCQPIPIYQSMHNFLRYGIKKNMVYMFMLETQTQLFIKSRALCESHQMHTRFLFRVARTSLTDRRSSLIKVPLRTSQSPTCREPDCLPFIGRQSVYFQRTNRSPVSLLPIARHSFVIGYERRRGKIRFMSLFASAPAGSDNNNNKKSHGMSASPVRLFSEP